MLGPRVGKFKMIYKMRHFHEAVIWSMYVCVNWGTEDSNLLMILPSNPHQMGLLAFESQFRQFFGEIPLTIHTIILWPPEYVFQGRGKLNTENSNLLESIENYWRRNVSNSNKYISLKLQTFFIAFPSLTNSAWQMR